MLKRMFSLKDKLNGVPFETILNIEEKEEKPKKSKESNKSKKKEKT